MFESEACLVKNKNLSPEKQGILDKLQFRLDSVLRARNFRYILMNIPTDRIEKVNKILPVLKSATVLPLLQEGWSSLHSVIERNKFWEVIDELKQEGATDILVLPIEKMVR